ncbi:MAG TPA: hypothetical protein VKK61_07350, partial [Tepidisphaeraceae bacterium]|nr:hypothetical protein [Tepidisphaeraceae bacterium]
LKIRSHIALPAPPAPPGEPDVIVRPEKSEFAGVVLPEKKTVLNATPDEICCRWDAGIFTVRKGREILVDAFPNIDPPIMAAWLQGAAMSLMLHQRGFLVLHSSAVAIKGNAVAFLGEVGWGKSTTATAFVTHGHRLLTDDVVAARVEGNRCTIVPGFPHVKLLPDAAEHLNQNSADMLDVAGDADKRMKLFAEKWDPTPVPLRAIYILGEADRCHIEPLPPQEALLNIMRHCFVARYTEFLQKTGTNTSHFAHCTQLVNSVSIGYLKRPRDLKLLPKLVEVVENELAGLTRAA